MASWSSRVSAWLRRSPTDADIPQWVERVPLLFLAGLAWFAAMFVGIELFGRTLASAFAIGVASGVMSLPLRPIEGARAWATTMGRILLAGVAGLLVGLLLLLLLTAA